MLFLHCGANVVPFESLSAVPTPDKMDVEMSDRYRVVRHDELAGMVRAIAKEKFGPDAIEAEEYALGGPKKYPGSRMFGLMRLNLDGEKSDQQNTSLVASTLDEAITPTVIEPDAIRPIIGFRNSYDKSMPVGFAMGHDVFICDNLAISGEIRYMRKHTRRAMGEIIAAINDLMGAIRDQHEVNQEIRQHAKSTMISDERGLEILGVLAGHGALSLEGGSTSQYAKALNGWTKHEEPWVENTMWDLFNIVTQAHKSRTNLAKLFEVSNTCHQVMLRQIPHGETLLARQNEIAATYNPRR